MYNFAKDAIAKSEEVVEPTLVIEMLNKRDKEKMLYSDDIARVEVGDTISWVPTSKGHNVQFVSVPEGVEKVKSKLSKESPILLKQRVYICIFVPPCWHGNDWISH